MSESQYGTVDVREMRILKSEAIKILLENIQNRESTPYNFDYMKPMILDDGKGGFIFRFFTTEFTGDSRVESIRLKSFEQIKTQWWLAELDKYGTGTLTDGPHDTRGGAEKALVIIKSISFLNAKDREFAIAKVELSVPTGEIDTPVNGDAIDTLNNAAAELHKDN